MQRRSFLVTLGSLAIASSLTGCHSPSSTLFRILALKNSLPPQLLGEFIKSIQPTPKVELATEGQFVEIAKHLEKWLKNGVAEAKGFKLPLISPHKSAEYIPNLVSIGDAWLASAIESGSIEQLSIQDVPNWRKLEARWQELARRDNRGFSSSTGSIWGVPYRWGTTMIAYRKDLLNSAQIAIPQDWEDLWQPKLKQRISVLDRSREVIGLTLKKLGLSYNQADLIKVENLKSELEKLHHQVKFYSSDNYLQPLILGDTWVAVGWSADLIDLIQDNPNIGAIVPKSGTAIWADLWVQPKRKDRVPVDKLKLSQQWIDYCLDTKVSNQFSLFTNGTAPLLTNLESNLILPDIQQNPLILPDRATLSKSEFLYPLAANTKLQYDELWQRIRQTN